MGHDTNEQTTEHDEEMANISQSEIDEKPWKYLGYKALTTFVSSSDDFLAVRRFDTLHCRILLSLQDEVAQLEDELDRLDKKLSSRDHVDVDNGTFRHDQLERRALLSRARQAVKEYDEFLLQYQRLKQFPKAPRLVLDNMTMWLRNAQSPIDKEEVAFLQSKDLVTPANVKKSAFRVWLEHTVLLRLQWWRHPAEKKLDVDRDMVFRHTSYMADDCLDKYSGPAVVAATAFMLIAPMWILTELLSASSKLGVITGFILLLALVMNWGVGSTPFETLAVTAGYSAVLVVFLQVDKASMNS